MNAYHQFPDSQGFCETPSALRMREVIDLSIRMKMICNIFAVTGTGKTTTLKHYARAVHGVCYCVMTPEDCDVRRMSRTLSRALTGFDAANAVDADYHIRDMTPRMKGLLIDEAQHLKRPALEQLRSIHDIHGIPLVLAGHFCLSEQIGKEKSFEHFRSRVGFSFKLRQTTDADIDALARFHGIEDEKAKAWLCKHSDTLRGAARSIQFAARLRTGDGPVTLDHLKRAAKGMGGAL